MFSLVLIKDFEIILTKSFYYTSYAFRIWDLFNYIIYRTFNKIFFCRRGEAFIILTSTLFSIERLYIKVLNIFSVFSRSWYRWNIPRHAKNFGVSTKFWGYRRRQNLKLFLTVEILKDKKIISEESKYLIRY